MVYLDALGQVRCSLLPCIPYLVFNPLADVFLPFFPDKKKCSFMYILHVNNYKKDKISFKYL